MYSERQHPELSIAERIKAAKEELGVSKAEIEQEMIVLFQKRNAVGIKEMFDAYLDWEIREANTSPKQRTQEEVRSLAIRNFDYVASVADNRKITSGDEFSAIVIATESPTEIVGPIRQFYRDTIGYHPEPPKTQLN